MSQSEETARPAATSPAAVDDPRLAQALEEYLTALESGQRPDRRALEARYPDIADELAGALEGLDLLHGTAPQLMPPPEPARLVPPAPASDAAAPLGDYRLLREVGRGGMGIVYEAVQLSLGRRVALKVLPFAAALDQKQLQRFKHEAQAAALLHHTNIVPVFHVGCERGVYYYAMQFIEGRTVAAFIQELRQRTGLEAEASPGSASAPTRAVRSPLTPDEVTVPYLVEPVAPPHAETACQAAATTAAGRALLGPDFFRSVARLGVQAAEALEYAHQQGVVHRDVKPANLLLDDQERLWVADFGLARSRNDGGLTLTGDLVGTVRYMSPEQALGKPASVDHRTDVYSLGATLYELLTLEPVFPGTDRHALLQQIASEEPRSPRRVHKSIPHELETIVLKALAKVPDERYSTAQELADDLHRFLEDRPLLARRPTLREKTVKWFRRHRAVTVAAVAVLILASASLAASTVLIAQEQARTRKAYEAEAAQRARAEANFAQARGAIDYLTQVSEEDMADRPEMQAVRRKLLEAARDYYQSFIDQHPDDPSVRAELAESHQRIGRILERLESPEAALAAMEKARELQEKLVRENPTRPEFQRGLASIYHEIASMQARSSLPLLSEKSVQDELKLTPEQVGKITAVADARREALREYRHEGPEELKTKIDEQEKTLEAALDARQLRRLRQVALQQQGNRGFASTEVAEALGLSEEQRGKIKSILDEANKAIGRLGPRPPDKRKLEERARHTREQLVNVLTEEQKVKWEDLTGEPFKGEIRNKFPGGRRPPPWSEHRRHGGS